MSKILCTFAALLNGLKYPVHINHDEYYRDRLTERDLCYDFPGDEILIDGLHAMQTHFWTHNVPVDIPVVRVMNAAHFIAAYMFATTCSGDQAEYDVLAYGSIGHDKKLIVVTMLVLAAMLERTQGFRARNCRDVIIAGRGEDFKEGLTLYERFLKSAEKRFAEEDFLIDTHTQIQKLVAKNEQLTEENIQLKYTITTMEEKYTQVNIGTQNNNCTQIGAQYNITYVTSPTETHHYAEEPSVSPRIELFKYIHVAITDEKEREQIHKMVCNIVCLPKMQQVCDELYKLMKDRKVLCTINPDSMLVELRRLGLPTADKTGFSDANFFHYYQAPKLD